MVENKQKKQQKKTQHKHSTKNIGLRGSDTTMKTFLADSPDHVNMLQSFSHVTEDR